MSNIFVMLWTDSPSSPVHSISQARILEWVAISFSRGFFLTQGLNPRLLLGEVDFFFFFTRVTREALSLVMLLLLSRVRLCVTP